MIHKSVFSLTSLPRFLVKSISNSNSNSCCGWCIYCAANWRYDLSKARRLADIYVRQWDILLYIFENKTNTSYTLSINNSKLHTHTNI